MTYRWATWLVDVLEDAGCPVVAEPGWSTRGRPGGTFEPRGIMLHHDASPAGETSHGADIIINGRPPDVPGPLAQLWLAFDGTWHVCAAGRANHAGAGSWPGIPTDNANSYMLGLETDHTTNEQWTADQRQSGIRGLIALADHLGIRSSAADLEDSMIAHKEWAPTRKVDPDPLDMDDLRAVILNPPTADDGTPVDTLTKTCDEPRGIGGDWTNLHLSEKPQDPTGNYAVRRGPASWFALTAQLYVEGVPGTIVQVRPWKDDAGARYSLRQAVIDVNGFARIDLAQQGVLESGQWLRIEAWASFASTVTVANCQIATW